jgi:hypothetical protein
VVQSPLYKYIRVVSFCTKRQRCKRCISFYQQINKQCFQGLLTINGITAWSGILMDGYGSGQTQVRPRQSARQHPKCDFRIITSLWTNIERKGVGGYPQTRDAITAAVTIFNYPMIIGDTIIVVGGYFNSSNGLPSCEQ